MEKYRRPPVRALNDDGFIRRICSALECAHANDDFDYLDLADRVLGGEEPFRCWRRDPHEYLARIHVERGNYNRALELLESAMSLKLPIPFLPKARRWRSDMLLLTFAEALLNLHRLDEAAEILDFGTKDSDVSTSIGEAYREIEMFGRFPHRLPLIRDQLTFLRGETDRLVVVAKPSWYKDLPPLHRSIAGLRSAILAARCGEHTTAEILVFEAQDQDRQCYSSLTKRLHTLAIAEIERAKGNLDLSLSLFRALAALGHPDAFSFLQASTLALASGRSEQANSFLVTAIELDPESYWSELARTRL